MKSGSTVGSTNKVAISQKKLAREIFNFGNILGVSEIDCYGFVGRASVIHIFQQKSLAWEESLLRRGSLLKSLPQEEAHLRRSLFKRSVLQQEPLFRRAFLEKRLAPCSRKASLKKSLAQEKLWVFILLISWFIEIISISNINWPCTITNILIMTSLFEKTPKPVC